jgi:glycogen(starch) synthase
MKVLYVSPYPPAEDGIGTYTRVLAGAVRAAGHQTAVVAAYPSARSPTEVIGALAAHGARRRLRDAVAAFGPDVVHVQFAVPAFGARTPALAFGLRGMPVPVVATMHEVTRDLALLRGPGRALYRRIAGCCDHVIAHTQAALEALTDTVGVPPGRAGVIPHFSTDPPAATCTAREIRARFGLDGERLLLCFGFIHVDKGLDDLVRALAVLRRTHPGLLARVRLVVAGAVRRRRGPFRVFELRDRIHFARVKRLARRHGLDGRMVHTGFVPDGEIAAWFAAVEAVVLPYRKAEQSGVAGLARAFGAPVIATTAGGLAELSSWSVPPGAPDLLAETIAEFLREDGGKHRYPGSTPSGEVPAPAMDLGAVAAATIAVYRAVRDRNQEKSPGAA